jgi:hypothetical protein
MDKEDKPKGRSTGMDPSDWKRIEELIHQAGGVANAQSTVPDTVRADAMSFHTLGLVLLDLQDRLARLESASNQPMERRIITHGY